MLARVKLPVLILSACLGGLTPSLAAGGYAMYVWSYGFDSTKTGCDAAKLVAWDTSCLSHNWATAQSRQWLWDTANRPERKIDRLFVSGINLKPAFQADNCSDPAVLAIKEMLRDGHCQVPGVAIHALFSNNDVAVSEQTHVPAVVWYNDHCAGAPNARFDGIAVNNETWGRSIDGIPAIRCSGSAREKDYLDDLQAVTNAAHAQVNGSLATHYSISFAWNNKCPGDPAGDSTHLVDWNGTRKPPTHHMIDIFDSVDVQVATIEADGAASQAIRAGYDYAAIELGKPFYVLSRTNKNPAPTTVCADDDTTHFPCTVGPDASEIKTVDHMTQFFEELRTAVPAALPAIHAFRQVYSAGGHPDWPRYYSGSPSLCIPPVTFANPVDDEKISWPAQDGATDYELARANTPTFVGCRLLPLTPERTSAVDTEQPNPSSAFFYLVRVLAPVAGDWGKTSAGNLRSVSCP